MEETRKEMRINLSDSQLQRAVQLAKYIPEEEALQIFKTRGMFFNLSRNELEREYRVLFDALLTLMKELPNDSHR